MKKALSSFAFLFSLTGIAQDTPKPSWYHWTLGAKGGVNLYDDIKSPVAPQHHYSYQKTGFRSGIDLSWHPGKRWAINAGADLFRVSYSADYAFYALQPNDPNIPVHSDVGILYLDIPLNLTFNIIAREKMDLYLSYGAAIAFPLAQSGSTTYDDGSVRDFDYLKDYNFSIPGGAGVRYKWNENTAVKFEARYRQFVPGFDSIMELYPEALSLTLGIESKIQWKCFFKGGAWQPLPRCE